MAESPSAKPDIDDLHWCDGSTPEGKTEPDEAKKDDGWATDDIPPSEEFNWRWNFIYTVLSWIGSVIIRRFTSFLSAVEAGLGNGDLATIRSYVFSNAPFQRIVDVHTDIEPLDCDTDNRYLYCADHTGGFVNNTVHAFEVDNLGQGEEAWIATLSEAVSSLCAPGSYVYVGFVSTSGNDKVVGLVPSTGAVALGPVTEAHNEPIRMIKSNGSKVAYIHGSTVAIRNSALSSIINYVLTGTSLEALCVDSDYAFAIGGGGTNNIVQVDLSTGSASVANFGGASWILAGICTDGTFLYVYSVSTQTVYCLKKDAAWFSVSLAIWSTDISSLISSSPSPVYTAVDDKWLFVGTENRAVILDKQTGAVIEAPPASEASGIMGVCANGREFVVCGEYSSTDFFSRIFRGSPSRIYMKCSSVDIYRRPFYNLFCPIDDA